ncbi:hypothetical protein FACS1894190_08460 [Spirochaetia bacterium]|nr:hypothetical protein FACS1894190_08460 [Spirochaetia bacterium]
MVPIGLLSSIGASVALIATGREGLDIKGEAEAGRTNYHNGMDKAIVAFTAAAKSNDVELMILVEHAFLTEEKRFCDSTNKAVLGSLTHAVESFDDALRALESVMDVTLYRGADLAFPRNGKYRVGDMPKDAFHIACIAHRTRLNNTLKTPGLNSSEQNVYKQRIVNMRVAQNVYLQLQNEVLKNENIDRCLLKGVRT